MNSVDIQKAIIEAADASDLGTFQKNRIKRIMGSSVRPFARRSITNRVTEALLAEELVMVTESGVSAAVDWTSILEFIKTMLPIILQLIALFA
jgi:hypothetical protein